MNKKFQIFLSFYNHFENSISVMNQQNFRTCEFIEHLLIENQLKGNSKKIFFECTRTCTIHYENKNYAPYTFKNIA